MESILELAARKSKVLSRAEQIALVEKYQAGDQKALDKLVKSNLRLACKFAKEYKRTGVEFEDLLAEAVQGIMKAADKYELGSEAAFHTYAAQWMRAFCQDYVQANCSTIRVGTRTGRKLYASLQRIRRIHGPDVSAEVIAKELNLDQSEVAEALIFIGRKAQSIDAAINESGGTVATLIADDKMTAEQELENHESLAIVRQHIDIFSGSISERDAFIFNSRSVADDEDRMGLQELGDMFSISKERVRQIENKILSKFQTYLHSKLANALRA